MMILKFLSGSIHQLNILQRIALHQQQIGVCTLLNHAQRAIGIRVILPVIRFISPATEVAILSDLGRFTIGSVRYCTVSSVQL